MVFLFVSGLRDEFKCWGMMMVGRRKETKTKRADAPSAKKGQEVGTDVDEASILAFS